MFVLDETQTEKLKVWCGRQDQNAYVGAIGGLYTYSFTPTGLGEIAVVKNNATGEEINLTDFDSW